MVAQAAAGRRSSGSSIEQQARSSRDEAVSPPAPGRSPLPRRLYRFLRVRSLQAKILALFVLLIVVVQVGGFILINTAGISAARKSVGAEVLAGTRVFDRVIRQDHDRLRQGARLLTADYAFREAITTGDTETIASVLANHGDRIGATVMMLVGLDRRVLADTAGTTTGQRFAFPDLLETTDGREKSPAMVVMRGQVHQLVVVPILAPLPVAWLAVGFKVDDALAQELHRLTRLQVSFMTRPVDADWRIQATTLDDEGRRLLLADMNAGHFAATDFDGKAGNGDEAITRVLKLSSQRNQDVVAVLQEPLSEALEPYRQLQRRLALISLLGILVSIAASIVIARGIGRPVRDLAGVARRIAAGDYSVLPRQSRNDEIGDLATAFRSMQKGIAKRESRITELAYRDGLTNLPNRACFANYLGEALGSSIASSSPVAVLLMDLDHFRYVNDTLGHAIGDSLLCEVAARLQAVVRRASDTVARLGGDEFAILLPGASLEEATRAGEAILRVLEAPMSLEGHVVDVRASIGVAGFPEHGNDASTLLRHADVAMYEAKRTSRGVVAWDDQYDQHSLDRLSLMSDLRKAIDRDELMLVYQPKVSLGVAADHHVEALVRWRHPARGLVPPSEFVPFAEQTGYIRVITQWVIDRAVAQCGAWRRGDLPVNISINLSARDLIDSELPDRFEERVNHHGCSPAWFSFEITESAILDDPGRAIRNLERLHALGCKLAIDDYGTGYSSLAYLRNLPVQQLKIDKSFVMGLAADRDDEIIVRSTIELGHNMGLLVIAEGVEDEPTFERLRSLGCDMAQGYWLSRPLDAAAAETWMRDAERTAQRQERQPLRRVG